MEHNKIAKLPREIQEITTEIEEAHSQKKFYEERAKLMDDKWLRLYRERQSLCNHVYADGTSAWRHNYAYSNCDICGYSDL